MGVPHLLFILGPLVRPRERTANSKAARQELNSVGNSVADALQSLTRRNWTTGLAHSISLASTTTQLACRKILSVAEG